MSGLDCQLRLLIDNIAQFDRIGGSGLARSARQHHFPGGVPSGEDATLSGADYRHPERQSGGEDSFFVETIRHLRLRSRLRPCQA